jgi:CRP-like cAMP-binding protein
MPRGRCRAGVTAAEEAPMNAPAVQPLLAQHPFAREFQPQQIERLATQARTATFAAEQVIFREGDECNDFYLIVSGRVALEMVVGNRVLRIQTLGDGDEFGWSALITGRGKHFQARALTPLAALAFDGSQLLENCRRDPELGFSLMYRLLGIVAERLQATRLQLIDTYSPIAARAGA